MKNLFTLGVILFFVVFPLTSKSCPSVDQHTTLYWAHNPVYDDYTGYIDDFLAAFLTWTIQVSENGSGSWWSYEIDNAENAKVILTSAQVVEDSYPFGSCLVTAWEDGRIAEAIIYVNPVYPWYSGEGDDTPSGYLSVRALLTHEVGHLFGAGHAENVTNCAEFLALDLEQRRANFPTMTVGSQTGSADYNWGLTLPVVLFHTLAPADIAWVEATYPGVVHNEIEIEDDLDENPIPSFDPISITNFPNPFNPRTEIIISSNLHGQEDTLYQLKILDIKGMIVFSQSGRIPLEGESIVWNGTNTQGKRVSTGVYTVHVETEGTVTNKKIALIK